MSLVSAPTLALLRQVAAAALPDTAQVERYTTTSDGMGGANAAWTVVATYPCRVSRIPQIPREGAVADQLAGRVPFYVFLPFDADATGQDRILALGETYEVLGVHAPTSYQVHVRLTCARLSGAGEVAL